MFDTERKQPLESLHLFRDVVERSAFGVTILSPSHGRVTRRVLYVNSYGGTETLERVRHGGLPAHHLWGCLELARLGYEVALADPLSDFYFWRRPLPHDLKLMRLLRAWLGHDGIVYCGHNVLYWIPFLKAAGFLRCRVVSLLFGREPLAFARSHSGIIGLNGAAADHARMLSPSARVAQLGWGVELSSFPAFPYRPEWFLCCGQTQRDHSTLARAAALTIQPIRVISPALPPGLQWPANARLITGGRRDDTVSYQQLFKEYYAGCAASLIILKSDPSEATGVGFTNLLEAMAMSRPVIVTKTGALPSELDVERQGCGLSVPPEDPQALANAINWMASNPAAARQMGEAGKALCEKYYNIERFGNNLHSFFDAL